MAKRFGQMVSNRRGKCHFEGCSNTLDEGEPCYYDNLVKKRACSDCAALHATDSYAGAGGGPGVDLTGVVQALNRIAEGGGGNIQSQLDSCWSEIEQIKARLSRLEENMLIS
jgi:hypothetical protein